MCFHDLTFFQGSVQWFMHVITAIWEAEVGRSFELRLHHCSPGWVTEWDSISKMKKKNWGFWPGMLAHTCNLSTLGGWGEGIAWGQEFESNLDNMVKPPLLIIQQISQACWQASVIPATREAEAGELPEPRRRRLQWAKIAPLHSSLGNKSETPSQKKKEFLWEL